MQTATDLPARSVTKAAQSATAVVAVSRLRYVDMIRFVLIVLVIMVHAAVTYGSAGDWTYRDNTANDELTIILLSLFVFCSQSFFMGLFFFFAGYFTPGSYDKKGTLSFWKDRLLHLAIPMILYTWFLSRVPNYMDRVVNDGLKSSFWDYSLSTYWWEADGGPTWFLFALLGFSIAYTIWRLISRGMRSGQRSEVKRLPAPTTKTLIATALVMAVLMFIVSQFNPIIQAYKAFGIFSLMLAFFPFYIILFVGGILAYRNDWLTQMSSKMRRFWGWVSAGLIIILPVFLIGSGAKETGLDPFMSGITWRCALMCLWLGWACIAFSTTLTLWLRDTVKPGNKLAVAVGPDTFTVYLIHPLVLVAICVWLTPMTIHPMLKFVLSSLGTVIVCYALAEVLRRIPVIKRIL